MVGQIQVDLSVGTKKVNSQFVVTTSGRCLLGHITSRNLGLLRIGLSASSEWAKCHVVGNHHKVQCTREISSTLSDCGPSY